MNPPPVLLSLALWAGAALADEPLSKPADNRLRIQRGVVVANLPFLGASGGRLPHTFTVDAAALPAGITVSPRGTLSGITCGGDGVFLLGRVSVSDAAGAVMSASTPMLTVDPAPRGGCTLALRAQPARPVVGQPYRSQLAASGGVAPYRFATAAGHWPAGLTLTPNGMLSGTPAVGGRYAITLAVRDAVGATGAAGITLDVASLELAPAQLPPGTAGIAYGQALAATGGTPPYGYAVTSGVLPAGLSLSRNGRLGGIPGVGGSARFSVQVTDANGVAATRGYTLRIRGSGTAPRAAFNEVAAAAAFAPEFSALHTTVQGAAVAATPQPVAGPARDASARAGGEDEAATPPDPPDADPVVAALQAAEADAIKRLGAAQVRNVLARLDGDTDCRPGWEQRLRLNAEWRDARPAWAGSGDAAQTGLAVPVSCTSGPAAWAAGTVDYGRASGAAITAASRFTTPGLTAGIDLAPAPGLRSGIALGHAQDRGELGGGAAQLASRSDSITAYGSWQAPLGVRVDVALGQAYTLLDRQRTVGADAVALQGQRRVMQRFGALAGSTRIEIGRWRVVPRLGVEHMRALADGYAENAVSPLALGYAPATMASSDLHGALALTRQWRPALWTVEPQLSVDWSRRLQGATAQALRYTDDALGTSYALTSAEPAAELAHLGLGVRLAHPQGWSLSLGARSLLDGGALRSAGYSAAMQWPF